MSWCDAQQLVTNRDTLADPLAPVLQVLQANNPVVQKYMTMLKEPSMTHGYPIVTADVLTRIIDKHSDRAPIEYMSQNPVPSLLSTYATVDAVPPKGKTNTVCGKLHERAQPDVPHDLLMQAAETPLPTNDSPDKVTVEQALFPYLFVFGTGAWDGTLNFCVYLRMRMCQLFSPFTLCKNYLLLMYHVQQTHHLVTDCAEATLQRYIAHNKRNHPDATEQEVMSNTLKHAVPNTVPGSPAFFRNKLKELLAMVNVWGLPDFFLTLTIVLYSPVMLCLSKLHWGLCVGACVFQETWDCTVVKVALQHVLGGMPAIIDYAL